MNNEHYPSINPLYDILLGPIKMAVLEAALELKIADILEQATKLADIASALDIKTDPAGLGFFLDSMVSMGFVEKSGTQYKNTDFGKHFLCTPSPVYMGGFVKNITAMQYRNLGSITHIVKNGPPGIPPGQELSSEAKWKNAVAHLASYQRAGAARLAADLVESLPEYATATRLLDLGGGPGIMGMEMVRRNSGLSGVLLDLPGIIHLAGKEVQKEGLESRISFIAGDYNEVDLGEGYDIIWASHNLYYVKEPVAFFRRIKAAMTPSGVFVCVHEGLTEERTQPMSVILPRLSLALEGQDVSFEKGQIASFLGEAGFERVETGPFSLGMGEGELVVARKN